MPKYVRFLLFLLILFFACNTNNPSSISVVKPIVITTWENIPANKEAISFLVNGKSAMESVEAGIRIKEADETDSSVGLGGLPDATGEVTLDACIMDEKGNAGSVTFLAGILHPISVARKVMENTDHVILSGQGALEFALEQGFSETNLLTDSAKSEWEKWKESNKTKKADNHDTVGMLAMDQNGNISGGCSTSGMAFKLKGRVGDSPIIGAGLYVDNKIGGATATGKGEEVLKTLGSFLIVELMRNGHPPQKACELAINRIAERYGKIDFQVAYLAMDKKGNVGAYSLKPGFEYTYSDSLQTVVNKSLSHSD